MWFQQDEALNYFHFRFLKEKLYQTEPDNVHTFEETVRIELNNLSEVI